ncbi:MAG: hypothetical protein ACI35U_00495 [Marinilabiliaceae bacterium]|nr:hypothetical protein [Bacteroidales bacterium]MDY4520179.1 hypothetical protein [Bacteroidales bacterium]
MSGNIIKRIVHSTKSKDFRTFLLFLLLSTLIWNIEKLRQTYTVQTQLSVRSQSIPEGYLTRDADIKKINTTLEGNGFSLLRMYMTDSRNVKVDISKLQRLSMGGQTWALFIPRRLVAQETDLPEHVRVVEVQTDTIMLPLLTVSKKRVPIVLRDSVSVNNQYTFSTQCLVEPDSVEIVATNDIIDTIQAIYSEQVILNQLADTVTSQRRLTMPQNTICSIDQVEVTYFVEPLTEKKIAVPIVGINVPKGYKCKIFPTTANTTFSVALSKFEKADSRAFRIVANFDHITPGGKTKRLKLELENQPDYVRNVSFSPTYAEFLLEREHYEH